jgi:hypothetical protein
MKSCKKDPVMKCFMLIVLAMLMNTGRLTAQDTLQPYRQFLAICSGYQQAPLQLNISYKSSASLVLNAYDTMSMSGYFCVTKSGDSYLRMGDVEQLINDSVAVMINHSLRQLMLGRDADKWRQQVKGYLGMITSDTSVLNLSRQFVMEEKKCDTNASMRISQLSSRSQLGSATLPRQVVTVVYNRKSMEPVHVITLRRTLIPVDRADSAAFVQRAGKGAVLLTVPGVGLCYVREYTGTYTFQSILHEEARKIPLQLSEYLVRKKDGEYEMSERKSDYRLSIED